MERYLLAICVLLLVGCGRAEGSESPERATPPPRATKAARVADVGERIISSGISLTVDSVIASETANGSPTLQSENVYLKVDVTLENIDSRRHLDYNAFHFTIIDSEGLEYIPSTASFDDALYSGELHKNETISGSIDFEVPHNADNLVLIYVPLLASLKSTPLRVDLGDVPPTQ